MRYGTVLILNWSCSRTGFPVLSPAPFKKSLSLLLKPCLNQICFWWLILSLVGFTLWTFCSLKDIAESLLMHMSLNTPSLTTSQDRICRKCSSVQCFGRGSPQAASIKHFCFDKMTGFGDTPFNPENILCNSSSPRQDWLWRKMRLSISWTPMADGLLFTKVLIVTKRSIFACI